MKNNAVLTRLLARGVLVCALSCGIPASAGELDDFFNEVGAYGNITGPAAYRGQAMNYYTPGSLFYRIPNKTYSLADLAAPSLRAGCGGISLYGGAFSYINKNEFIDMLRNIGQNAMGVAFDMALTSLCPVCSSVLGKMEEVQRFINGMNINSCQAATGLIKSPAATLEAARSYVATGWARITNTAADDADARHMTNGNDTQTASMVGQALATDPATKRTVPSGNLVWRALKSIPMNRANAELDDLQRQILMSLTGTVVYHVDTEKPRPKVWGATVTKLADFIGDPTDLGGAGNPTMTVYQCDTLDADGCLNPRPVMLWELEDEMRVIRSESLAKMVETRLLSILTKIQTNTPLDAGDTAFIGTSSLPVYKLLSVGAAVPGYGEAMITQYREVLAAEYAAAYVSQARKAIRTALDHMRNNGTGLQREEAKEIEQTIDALERRVTQELAIAKRHASQFASVADEILKMERQLFATMPVQLGQNLTFLGVK